MIKGFFKSYKVKCNDGSKKIIYKNADDAFPLHIGTHDLNFTAKLKSELLSDGQLSGGLTTKVDSLLVGLNDINNGVMMAFRSAYIGYSADPCGNGVEFLRTEISKVNEEQRRLKVLAMQIRGFVELAKANPEKSDLLTEMYINLLNDMRSTSVGNLGVEEALKTSSRAIQHMIGGK